MKRHALSIALLSLTLAACGGGSDDDNTPTPEPTPTPTPTPVQPRPLALTLLHINDHHSHLDAERTELQLAMANGERKAVSVPLGGFPRVTSAIESLAAESANVIKIHSGDAITGDLYYTLSSGKADAELMNTVCFDTFTLGNHEFDGGDAGLKNFLGHLAAGNCGTVPLSANVRFGAESPLHSSRAPDVVRRSTVLERDGQKIGLVGVTIANKTQNASRPDAGTIFEDEIASVQTEIDALRESGIDKIIVQSHVGYGLERQLATSLRGVDVVVGGDSHSLLGPASMKTLGLTPEGDYPTRLSNRDGKPVCVVQAWQYSYVVGELKVQFDDKGDVTSCEGTPHLLIGNDFTVGGAPLAGADLTAALADVKASGVLRVTAPSAKAEAALAAYSAEKVAFGGVTVGRVAQDLCLRRVPGRVFDPTRSRLGDACNLDPHVIQHGGDIQQWVADAFLAQGKRFFDADIALQNGGGVRVDVATGPLTVADVYTVLPFKNTLVQLNLTGAEIHAALEDAVDGMIANRGSGSYPYAGGLRWHVDLNQPKGQRFSQLEVLGADGAYRPLDRAAEYKVITIDFLADGADYYDTLGRIPAERRVDVGLDYAEAFLTYVQAQAEAGVDLMRLSTDRYSTQQFIDLAP